MKDKMIRHMPRRNDGIFSYQEYGITHDPRRCNWSFFVFDGQA
jgi:hypothetical protein